MQDASIPTPVPPDARPASSPAGPKTVVIQQRGYLWLAAILLVLLLLSGMMNMLLIAAVLGDSSDSNAPSESYVSGSRTSDSKIALLEVEGTIMPPFTERWLQTIRAISKDQSVKGVVLRIDSPGGLVADSHQIYHALNELREERNIPVFVSMGRIAASGGYYIAMGGGLECRIFAEPTTWTGSIGVKIPRLNAADLAGKIGVEPDPLVTGKFKDTLSPLRDMTDDERQLWQEIIDESFAQFKSVILSSRKNLEASQLDELATGQVFTAQQANKNGLIDEIGFQDDVVAALTTELGLDDPKVVRYKHPVSLLDLVMGVSAAERAAKSPWEDLLGAHVPQAMYFFGWPGIGLGTAP